MEIKNYIVNPENVRESIEALIAVIGNHTDHIMDISKVNKRLTFSVVCLAAGGYLIYRYTKKQANRINELEKTVDTLVQIAVGKNPQEQQSEE